MFASRVRAASAYGHAPCGPSLARHHHEALFAQPPFGFQDEPGESVPVKAGTADLAEVMRESFFGRVQKQPPGDILKLCRSLRPERGQHQPHHYCAALDIMGSWT